jgi:hypothetical protein
MEKEKKAYKKILEVLNKYRNITVFDYDDLEQKSKYHLFGLELKEKYGLNIEPRDILSLEWNKFGKYLSIGLYGEKYRRTIAWSDDDKQPEDELLIVVGLSTGAYIFGDDYPQELFQQFWHELKNYNPKYSDTTNHYLYFTLEGGAKLFNEFNDILKKYYEFNKEDSKRRKIKKLQDELEKLK